MGWTFYTTPAGQTTRETLEKEINGERHRVLDCAKIGEACYLAVEVTDKETAAKSVQAYVFLVKNDRTQVHNFGYKDMHECMGPYYYDCPARILDLLTPTECVDSNIWRRTCREMQARKSKLVDGCYVLFAEPILFTNGEKLSKFIYKKDGRKERFVGDGGRVYRISGWKSRAWEVVNAALPNPVLQLV